MSRLEVTRTTHVRLVNVENEVAHALKETLQISSEVKAYILRVIQENIESVKECKSKYAVQEYVSSLIHTARLTKAKYLDFDEKFYKFPSYLRRALILECWADFCLYEENHAAWERKDKRYRNKHGKLSREPMLKLHRKSCPSMYKDGMYKLMYEKDGKYYVKLKLFNGKEWLWYEIEVKASHARHLAKKANLPRVELGTPAIIKKGKTYSLAYTITRQLALPKLDYKSAKVLAVDLGFSKLATCCVMDANGTILSRHFVTASHEIDHMQAIAKRIAIAQSKGARQVKRMYALLNNINDELTRRTIREVVKLAVENDCSVIVLEHLDFRGSKMSGCNNMAISKRRYRAVSEGIETHAHFFGIRVNRVCAYNTSRLAFDGTGKVLRGDKIPPRKTQKKFGYGQVEFRSGKLYDADLNASYNIGARWFIKKKLEALSKNQLANLQAKVPELLKRSTCTLSTLKALNEALLH